MNTYFNITFLVYLPQFSGFDPVRYRLHFGWLAKLLNTTNGCQLEKYLDVYIMRIPYMHQFIGITSNRAFVWLSRLHESSFVHQHYIAGEITT